MKTKSLIIASMLAISTAAFAQTPMPGDTTSPGMAKKGYMHEGKSMSRADAMTKAGEHFDRMDTNKDGMIDASERKAAHKRMRAMHKKMNMAGDNTTSGAPSIKGGTK